LEPLELGDVEREDIIRRETGLFKQQRNSLQADIAVLNARIQSTRQLQSSREGQILIAQTALDSARAELVVISNIFEQQLARRDQVTSAERLVATLEGKLVRRTAPLSQKVKMFEPNFRPIRVGRRHA